MTDTEKIAELETILSNYRARKRAMEFELIDLKEEIYSIMERIRLIKRN